MMTPQYYKLPEVTVFLPLSPIHHSTLQDEYRASSTTGVKSTWLSLLHSILLFKTALVPATSTRTVSILQLA